MSKTFSSSSAPLFLLCSLIFSPLSLSLIKGFPGSSGQISISKPLVHSGRRAGRQSHGKLRYMQGPAAAAWLNTLTGKCNVKSVRVCACEHGKAGERAREHACACSLAMSGKTNTFADQGDAKHAASAAAAATVSALSSQACWWWMTFWWTHLQLVRTQMQADVREGSPGRGEWDETGIKFKCFDSCNESVTFWSSFTGCLLSYTPF